jgi:hypothetical protein
VFASVAAQASCLQVSEKRGFETHRQDACATTFAALYMRENAWSSQVF